jgi:hypothetical protein
LNERGDFSSGQGEAAQDGTNHHNETDDGNHGICKSLESIRDDSVAQGILRPQLCSLQKRGRQTKGPFFGIIRRIRKDALSGASPHGGMPRFTGIWGIIRGICKMGGSAIKIGGKAGNAFPARKSLREK